MREYNKIYSITYLCHLFSSVVVIYTTYAVHQYSSVHMLRIAIVAAKF